MFVVYVKSIAAALCTHLDWNRLQVPLHALGSSACCSYEHFKDLSGTAALLCSSITFADCLKSPASVGSCKLIESLSALTGADVISHSDLVLYLVVSEE